MAVAPMLPATHESVDWQFHLLCARRFGTAGVSAAGMSVTDVSRLQSDLHILLSRCDWRGVIRLRGIYNDLLAADTVSVHSVFGHLSKEAIDAARIIGDNEELAHLLGAQGHNLHRAATQHDALRSFEESRQLYESLGHERESVKSYYMTGLCHKALGHIDQARQVIEGVLARVSQDDSWRGSPIQALGWMVRDSGDLVQAETMFRQALDLHRRTRDGDILVAGALADLGEVLGMRGRLDEGIEYLEESLRVLREYGGQFLRQESRTEVKIASLYLRRHRYDEALELLSAAEDRLIESSYYDTIWKIELMRAATYGFKFRLGLAFRKMMSAIRLSHQLGYTTGAFVQQMIRRATTVIGTPLLARIARFFH